MRESTTTGNVLPFFQGTHGFPGGGSSSTSQMDEGVTCVLVDGEWEATPEQLPTGLQTTKREADFPAGFHDPPEHSKGF